MVSISEHPTIEDDDTILSYEDDLILWILTEWRTTLSEPERSLVGNTIFSLAAADFWDTLAPNHTAVNYILAAWMFITSPISRERISADPSLANSVPYGILRVQDKIMALSG